MIICSGDSWFENFSRVSVFIAKLPEILPKQRTQFINGCHSFIRTLVQNAGTLLNAVWAWIIFIEVFVYRTAWVQRFNTTYSYITKELHWHIEKWILLIKSYANFINLYLQFIGVYKRYMKVDIHFVSVYAHFQMMNRIIVEMNKHLTNSYIHFQGMSIN